MAQGIKNDLEIAAGAILGVAKEIFPPAQFKKIAKVEEEREVRVELTEFPEAIKAECTTVIIEQSKLEEFKGGYIRVRKETPGGYTFTRKDFSQNLEDTVPISEAIFKILAPHGQMQKKTRYRWRGWDIDIMDGGKKIVAEFEMVPGQDQVIVPPEFSVKNVGTGTKIVEKC